MAHVELDIEATSAQVDPGPGGWLSWIPHAERLATERMVVCVQLRRFELAGERKGERTMSEENKTLARRAWEVVFNQRNLDALYEFYAADAVWHQPDRDLQGLEEIEQWLARPFEAFPDLNVTIDDVIAEGDKVVIRYTSRGTHQGETGGLGPPTGRQIELEGIAIHRFEGSKTVEFWDRFDTLSLLQQLELTPEQ